MIWFKVHTHLPYPPAGLHKTSELSILLTLLSFPGTTEESTSAFDLHAKSAHRADKAAIYNHAAMLEFTRLYWETLTDSQDAADRRPGLNTMRSIELGFESLEDLREEFLETADALFGNGFVWLMKGPRAGALSILATYNAGSPYPEAAPRRDSRDMATIDGAKMAAQLSGRGGLGGPILEERPLNPGSGPQSSAGFFGDLSSARANLFQGALDAQPVLCVNVWQHQYVLDWGTVGKRPYLAAWWDHIDWQVVERRLCDFEVYGDKSDYAPGKGAYSQGSVMDAIQRAL